MNHRQGHVKPVGGLVPSQSLPPASRVTARKQSPGDSHIGIESPATPGAERHGTRGQGSGGAARVAIPPGGGRRRAWGEEEESTGVRQTSAAPFRWPERD